MHGRDVDDLLRLFLGIVVLAMLLVHVGLVVVWLRRGGDSRMAWAPIAAGVMTLGLVVMFAVSERHWRQLKDNRSDLSQATDVQRLLVIGERFAWNTVGPGDDGELGRYLVFPKPDDELWPNPGIIDAATAADPPPYIFAGVAGPAELPEDERQDAIGRYTDVVNRLGKDFAHPGGWDDDWQSALARVPTVEVNRAVEVTLGSRDVIHDFFVPAMRVKMDAVPGHTGQIRFLPTEVGTFQVLCAEFCGWGHTQMLGELIVEEPS